MVVFPAPLGPRRAKHSPGAISKLTPSRAHRSPYLLRTSLTLMAASVTGGSWHAVHPDGGRYAHGVRILVARCTVDYVGRLTAHLPESTRVIMLKADGSVLIHSDGGSYKPLNWMSPPCTTRVASADADDVVEVWTVENKAGEQLVISVHEVIQASDHDLGIDPGLVKDGVEAHLQKLLATHVTVMGEGWSLVRREYPTAIGPVDLMCRDADGRAVAVEIKRRGEIDGVEQLTRYLELLNRDPLLAPCGGCSPRRRSSRRPACSPRTADRCVVIDYEALKGSDDPGLGRLGSSPTRDPGGGRTAMAISTVGVIGLGTMGAGIAQVVARHGFFGRRHRHRRGRARPRSVVDLRIDLARGGPRQDDRGRAGGAARPHHVLDRPAGALRGRPGHRGGVGEPRPEEGPVRAPRRDRPSARDPRHEHVVAVRHGDRGRDESARAASSACTSSTPRPVQAFVEVVRTVVSSQEVVDEAVAFATSLGKEPVVVGDKAGFIANALLFGYLNHAVSMFEQRYATREDIDASMRLGCGYPDGPAGAARPDRAGHRLRDPRHDVQAGPRSTACAEPHPQADGHGRTARSQDGPRLLRLRGTQLAGGRRHEAQPADGERVRPGGATTSASSGRAPWPRASSRCSPRADTPSCSWPAAPTRSPRCGRASRSRWPRPSSAARCPRPTATPHWPGCTGRPR